MRVSSTDSLFARPFPLRGTDDRLAHWIIQVIPKLKKTRHSADVLCRLTGITPDPEVIGFHPLRRQSKMVRYQKTPQHLQGAPHMGQSCPSGESTIRFQ